MQKSLDVKPVFVNSSWQLICCTRQYFLQNVQKLTDSMIAWYSTLKILISSTIYSYIWLALNYFWATRPDSHSNIWYLQIIVLN